MSVVVDNYRHFVVLRSRLVSLLEELDLTYPYHQAIGFHLERSGWPLDDLCHFREQPMEFDFYLDYAMVEPSYSSDWRLYYPRVFDDQPSR